MVAAVDHLVGVRQRDVGRRDAVFGEEAELLERPDPSVQWVRIGTPVSAWTIAAASNARRSRSVSASLPATLMTPARCSVRAMVGPR